jgi:heat shock protein HslJ/membrane-bound inhibitor of C-type lysozyme
MNKTKLWITGIAIVGILLLIGGGIATNQPVVLEDSATRAVVFYDGATNQSTAVAFATNSVTFTSDEFGTVTLPQVISADGARYANADESLVLWNKGDSVSIAKDGSVVFAGVAKPAEQSKPAGKLPAGSKAPGDPKALVGTWMWQKTMMDDGSVITPNKPGVFALTLSADGKASGKTDCNGFGGEYMVGSDGVLSFGPFMSTLMYCEGSQEAQFGGPLAKANSYLFDAEGNLIINVEGGTGMVIFTRQ